MKKKDFIEELKEKLNITENESIILNSIFEDTFFIGRKNKEKIVSEIEEKLSKTREEAENIYNEVMSTISSELKEQLKHPFKSRD